ncbi:MAG: DUF4332 domain-containing protein, partial [Dehalococcoidia bacterium]
VYEVEFSDDEGRAYAIVPLHAQQLLRLEYEPVVKAKSRSVRLEDIEVTGSVYAGKLRRAGIRSIEALLKAGATPAGRKEVAAKSGLSEKQVLEWVNHADLFRIKGVAEEYADLLEAAGVDTVVELGERNPTNLYAALASTNTAKKLVRKLPTEAQVAGWVAQAKRLPRAVSY